MKGVLGTLVGYAGGGREAPTYRTIGDHTEALLVAFDPEVLPYEKLLEAFWESHDPTSFIGMRQYRNVLFTHTEAQRAEAEKSLAEVEKRVEGTVRTAIEAAGPFHPAEDYHQKYYLRNNRDLYRALRELYPDEADFVSSAAAARLNGYLGGEGDPAEAASEVDLLGLSGNALDTVKKLGERLR